MYINNEDLNRKVQELYDNGYSKFKHLVDSHGYSSVYKDDKEYLKDFPFNTYTKYTTNRQGAFYIDNKNDTIKASIINNKGWEDQYTDIIKTHCKNGSVALDIGTHIGTHTITMAESVGNFGKVYCFEPNKKIYRELCYNIAANKNTNIIPIRAAIGNEYTIISPDTNDKNENNEGGTSISRNVNDSNAAFLFKIDDLNLSNISFIKMDVEGEELHALKGAEKTILQNKPVIFIEIWGGQVISPDYVYINGKHTTEILKINKEVIQYLESLGYTVNHIKDDDYLAIPK